MAFEIINATEIEVGDPVTASLFAKIKNSLDDHETRIIGLEGSDRRVVVFDHVVLNASVFQTATGLMFFQASFDFTLTEAKLVIFEKNSMTGFLEVDLKKNTSLNPAGFASIMTTKPKIDYSSITDYGESSNQAFDNVEKDIVAGDWLRLDITQMPSPGPIPKFVIIVYGEV